MAEPAGEVLVTPRSLTAHGLESLDVLDPLREAGYSLVSGPAGIAPTLDDLTRLSPEIVGWIAGVERIGAAELDLFPRLRAISRNGAGADGIDIAAAAERGIRVLTARGANARGVAELTIGLILNALRRISWSNDELHSGGWSRAVALEMPDVTLGVVGLGAIGQTVADLCAALGARVLAHDPLAPNDPAGATVRVDLRTLLQDADVVTLHAPAPPDGEPLLGAAEIMSMRRGAILVNTARSRLVDPDAVLSALNSGALSSYSVDAFDEEPPTLTPLLRSPGTVMTPHAGAYTHASVLRASSAAVQNLLTILGHSR